MCARSNKRHFTRVGMEFVSRGISLQANKLKCIRFESEMYYS